MKSLTLFIYSLMFLLTLQFNSATAVDSVQLPYYRNHIESVKLEYENALLGGKIKLNNGDILRIVDYKTCDDNVMATWEHGDKVDLSATHLGDRLVLSVKNLSGNDKDKAEPYVIFDLISSPESGLKIVEIADDGKFVKLNDKSVWNFSWWNQFSTEQWEVGQRVLVSGNGETNSYTFVNLDVTPSKNASAAKGTFVTP